MRVLVDNTTYKTTIYDCLLYERGVTDVYWELGRPHNNAGCRCLLIDQKQLPYVQV